MHVTIHFNYLFLNIFLNKLRKLLMLLLMLILPVQGFAAAYAPIHKALGGAARGEAMPCHEQPSQPSASAHHATDGSTTGSTYDTSDTNHLCCQQVFTGATTSAHVSRAHKFSDVSPFVLPLYTLFIPDSPDRPPRG